MKTKHFICKVQDRTNKHETILQIYCDVTTSTQAEKHFKNHPRVKPYLKDDRYLIFFQQNPG